MAAQDLRCLFVAVACLVCVADAISIGGTIGSDAILPCAFTFSGELVSTIQWYNGSAVAYGKVIAHNIPVNRGDKLQRYEITSNYSLLIRNLTLDDGGAYTCHVVRRDAHTSFQSTVALEMSGYPRERHPVIDRTDCGYAARCQLEASSGYPLPLTCRVADVYPLTFPTFGFENESRSYVTGEDGTFSTSVFINLTIRNPETVIRCSFTHRSFTSSSELTILSFAGVPGTNSQSANTEAIIGGSVGAVVVFVALVLICSFLLYRFRASHARSFPCQTHGHLEDDASSAGDATPPLESQEMTAYTAIVSPIQRGDGTTRTSRRQDRRERTLAHETAMMALTANCQGAGEGEVEPNDL